MKRLHLLSSLALVSVVSAGLFGSSVLAAPARDGLRAPRPYIIVLKDNVTDDEANLSEQNLVRKHGLGLRHSYRRSFRGFSADVSDTQLAAIKADPRVTFVSEDRVVEAAVLPGSMAVKSAAVAAPVQPAQIIPTGVSRLFPATATYTGSGIGVAVIDTGIDLTHPDLAANIGGNFSCVRGIRTGQDDNGHGTHVAGTVAALNNAIGTVGVAPKARLFAVKALNSQGSGTWSQIICGLDWVTANAARYNIKVANLSLGGAGTNDNNCGNTNGDALHKAICRARDAGVTVVVAAGNSAANAAAYVPAAYDDATIAVSALADSDGRAGNLGTATSYGADDTFATFSNYGTPIDVGAPGVNIFSTWLKGTYRANNGTSMAAPHVSGAAALFLQGHPGSTWDQVRDALRAAGEALNAGHTDPSAKHPESVVRASGL